LDTTNIVSLLVIFATCIVTSVYIQRYIVHPIEEWLVLYFNGQQGLTMKSGQPTRAGNC
jgi:hypothetical protein